MIGSGGTKGGVGKYSIGFGLAALATYLFLDSVKVSTMGHGLVSGLNRGLGLGGFWETTSMGIIFVPFFIGVTALFYNAKWKWAWGLIYLGLIILVIEILSRIRFLLVMKTTHLLLMSVLFAAGVGLMLQSYKEEKEGEKGDKNE